jgi:hypothetical protein
MEGMERRHAEKVVKVLAIDTDNIIVISYGRYKSRKRNISRRQIELCVQRGTIDEGPFLNSRGQWQMNFYRHAAGEQITCVVAIDWVTSVIVINAF